MVPYRGLAPSTQVNLCCEEGGRVPEVHEHVTFTRNGLRCASCVRKAVIMRYVFPMALVALTLGGCVHTSLMDIALGGWLLLATAKVCR